MTVAAAWVRKVGSCEELVFASDSRLTGGRSIDFCPKILALPRSDCAICFAGSTDLAYPLLLQLSLAIDSYFRSKTRALDLKELRTHLVKIFNRLATSVDTPIPDMMLPDVEFLFGGYSWVEKSFHLWRIQFNSGLDHFAAHPAARGPAGLGQFAFAGDHGREAKRQLYSLLRRRHGFDGKTIAISGFDFEPLEVIRDMLRKAGPDASIGGAPQVVKVYQHLNARPLAVFWPDRAADRVCLSGRPVLGYESIDHWILDPDTLVSWHPSFSASPQLRIDEPAG